MNAFLLTCYYLLCCIVSYYHTLTEAVFFNYAVRCVMPDLLFFEDGERITTAMHRNILILLTKGDHVPQKNEDACHKDGIMQEARRKASLWQ